MTWIRKRWLHLLLIFITLLLLAACQPSTDMPEEPVTSTAPEDTITRNILVRRDSFSSAGTNYGGCYPLYTEIPLKLEIEPERNATAVYDLSIIVVLKAYAEEESLKVTVIAKSESSRFEDEQEDYILSQGEEVVRPFNILFYDTWYKTEDILLLTFVRTEHLLEGKTNYCIEISTQLNGVKLNRLRG